jgi:hypothetical protein
MITTPTVSGKPGQAPTGLSCDLYPLIGSHSTWTDPRGPVSAWIAFPVSGRLRSLWLLTSAPGADFEESLGQPEQPCDSDGERPAAVRAST